MMKDFRAHREGTSKSWVRWRVPWTFAKCAWYVPVTMVPDQPNLTVSRRTVNCNHKWWMYALLAYLDVCWTFWVVYYSVAASNGYGYVLSYGQV